jgi:hypothetical protein
MREALEAIVATPHGTNHCALVAIAEAALLEYDTKATAYAHEREARTEEWERRVGL